MGKQLNTSPVVVLASAGVTDIISGAVLSGLVGAVSPSPRVRVKSVLVVVTSGVAFSMYKGTYGGSSPTTVVFSGFTPSNPSEVIPLGIVLETGEVLTALVNSGTPTDHVTCTVDAEITF